VLFDIGVFRLRVTTPPVSAKDLKLFPVYVLSVGPEEYPVVIQTMLDGTVVRETVVKPDVKL
jgi:hypothetical protein